MTRALAAALATLALLAGTARADSWVVLTPQSPRLPSASTPNAAGSIVVPPSFTARPAHAQTLGYAELESLWRRAGAAYGIPWQVLGAINKIESNFGRNMGPSSAGAIGWMQFMPSTWLRWGVDANGDGVADPWNPDDAVYAAARYLAAAGGQSDLRGAIFSYNHAQWYVDEVLALANTYVGGGTGAAASVDVAQRRLDRARADVVLASSRLVRAERVERVARRRVGVLVRRIRRTSLLSARLALQQRAAAADIAHERAAARVGALRATLRAVERTLASVQAATTATAFAPGTAPLLGAAGGPHDGYVFPVGGGPSVVSAGHLHHDYPAVDIAAPQGTPLYALADGTVVRAWHYPDPRCGIGMTIQVFDGQTWTYCHLAVLDPSIHAGTTLAAGRSVGLVGSTGDATGPHLHLQLQPPTRWPQQEAWFESFAGTAFRWQGDPAPRAVAAAPAPTSTGPVFQVLTTPATEVVQFSR